MSPRKRMRRADRGVTLVLFALCITILFLIVALVIDLGATRSDRRAGQVAVDNSTASAGQRFADDGAVSACDDAFAYLELTLEADPFVGESCGILSPECVSVTPRTVTRTSAHYTAVVHYPVLANSPLMKSSSTISAASFPVGLDADGQPCERIGLELTTSGDPFFGGVAGSTERRSRAHAVSLVSAGGEFRPINLLLLNRTECQVLTIGGGAKVRVSRPDDDSNVPGIVATDSDASDDDSCGEAPDDYDDWTVRLNGLGAELTAEGLCEDPADPPLCGLIELYAPVTNGSCAGDLDIPACYEQSGTITPDATKSRARYTRAPVDYRYNCKTSYDGPAPLPVEPWFAVQPIPGCEDATGTTGYVDELKAFAGSATRPDGFVDWLSLPGADCNAPNIEWAPDNYWVNCPTFRVSGAGTNAVFKGGNVVFTGNVLVNSGSLTFNRCLPTDGCANTVTWTRGGDFVETQYSEDSAWVYVRGSMSASAPLTLNNTALFLGSSTSTFSTSGTTTWTAPDGGPDVGDEVPEAAGPFDDLALWTEGQGDHTFTGGGTSTFEGLYFGGLAKFNITGGGAVNLNVAQFVSDKLAITGSAVFDMSPVGDRGVDYPFSPTFKLIR